MLFHHGRHSQLLDGKTRSLGAENQHSPRLLYIRCSTRTAELPQFTVRTDNFLNLKKYTVLYNMYTYSILELLENAEKIEK